MSGRNVKGVVVTDEQLAELQGKLTELSHFCCPVMRLTSLSTHLLINNTLLTFTIGPYSEWYRNDVSTACEKCIWWWGQILTLVSTRTGLILSFHRFMRFGSIGLLCDGANFPRIQIQITGRITGIQLSMAFQKQAKVKCSRSACIWKPPP